MVLFWLDRLKEISISWELSVKKQGANSTGSTTSVFIHRCISVYTQFSIDMSISLEGLMQLPWRECTHTNIKYELLLPRTQGFKTQSVTRCSKFVLYLMSHPNSSFAVPSGGNIDMKMKTPRKIPIWGKIRDSGTADLIVISFESATAGGTVF